ncbi:MAG: hypothetical protein QG653_108 [Patescibacteria group bacterium]|nr:hypothetical protein [Patescibacteria group bacterium]
MCPKFLNLARSARFLLTFFSKERRIHDELGLLKENMVASNNEGCVSYQEQSRILLRNYCKKQKHEKRMKKKDLATKYGIHPDTFRSWMRESHCGGPCVGKHGRLLLAILYSDVEDVHETIFAPGVPALLKEFRKEKGLTLQAFALYCQVDINTISHWEHAMGSPSLNKNLPLVQEFLEWAIRKDINRRGLGES